MNYQGSGVGTTPSMDIGGHCMNYQGSGVRTIPSLDIRGHCMNYQGSGVRTTPSLDIIGHCMNYQDSGVRTTPSWTGLETNARPLARGQLDSVRASVSSHLTSPMGEWIFFFLIFKDYHY